MFSMSDLFDVLGDPLIHMDFKRPYLRFLLWAYLATASVRMAFPLWCFLTLKWTLFFSPECEHGRCR